MSLSHIHLIPLFLAVFLSGCSVDGMASNPGSLANRVGNFSAQKLEGSRPHLSGETSTIQTQEPESTAGETTYIADGRTAEPRPFTRLDAGEFDQSEIIAAQSRGAKNVPMTVTARVFNLLPDDTRGKRHQRFLLKLNNGSTVLVAHNIDLAPHVPLRVGDMVTIKGEYVWNQKGGVMHYTHHSTNLRHEGGFIELAGKKYK